MNILILGSGGREHALAWKIKESKHCDKVFIAPGNAGTAGVGHNVPIGVNDFDAIKQFVIDNKVTMLVVGPEDPLVNGVYDYFKAQQDWKGMVIAPSKYGAQLEGSKAFSKKFMERHSIPTASYAEFNEENYEEGKAYIAQHSLPVVLKADGLAAGKGVVIAATHEEALHTFEQMILNKQFGEASSKVVIEQFLDGIEVSVFILTDGKDYKIIGHAKDYKRIGEGDTGLNTGGMGCVTPVPFMDQAFMDKVENAIIRPTVEGIASENIDYKGFIFFGLINVNGDPMVIEYNCRMGDPETEVIMPSLSADIVDLFLAVYHGGLNDVVIEPAKKSCVTVVAVSGGYPGDYEKGKEITLPDMKERKDSLIFHAGTQLKGDKILTSGGRVLAVTSYGDDIQAAAEKSRTVLKEIHFEGMNFRKDIGYEFK
ncbi:phosphoribosylamine--glycine ligase [Arachidicoccus rhizosphaerae]|uniref:Phosphoribosylamine--glycine ligase n=1 Tax=Arachidicoccus rhizosphaerae TaxID=551991 RepID=A0A1H3VKK0_9BACT|nr:phosphoribosylamine--glycine ligase [Arachidicoccus rhizosphaerae]SDZ74678.1 phosphoribosylamine--glycine ligase [Arachidicoccus rhizosphaerae]